MAAKETDPNRVAVLRESYGKLFVHVSQVFFVRYKCDDDQRTRRFRFRVSDR